LNTLLFVVIAGGDADIIMGDGLGSSQIGMRNPRQPGFDIIILQFRLIYNSGLYNIANKVVSSCSGHTLDVGGGSRHTHHFA
jgi:hypothetical protein